MSAPKILVIVFAVIIVILLAVLFFYNPAKAPAVPSGVGSTPPAATTQSY